MNGIICLIMIGCVWTPLQSGTASQLNDVDFVDVNHGWVVGGVKNGNFNDAIILKTSNGGTTWNNVTPSYSFIDEFIDVSAIDSLLCYVTAADTQSSPWIPYILKTTNGGNTWQILNAPYYTLPIHLHFISPNIGWTAGELDYQPMVLHTTDGGNTWVVQGWWDYNGGPCEVFFCNSQRGFVAGGTEDSPTTRGYIMTTTDGGNNWFESYHWGATIPYTWPLVEGVSFVDEFHGWACANLYGSINPYDERIIYTSDGGLYWDEIALISDTSIGRLHDIYMVDYSTGWVVCRGGDILHTTNNWTTWHLDTTNTTATLYAVDFPDPNHGYAVGSGGTILKYEHVSISEKPNDPKIVLNKIPNLFHNSALFIDKNFYLYDVTGKKLKGMNKNGIYFLKNKEGNKKFKFIKF